MKYLATVLALVLFASFSATAYDEEGPDELIKLNKNAEKVFHYKKSRGSRFISLEDGLTKPYPGKPQEAAEEFLKENHELLFLSEDLSEIKFWRGGGIPTGNLFEYKQYYMGIHVMKTGVSVELDRDNRAYAVTSGLLDISNDFSINPSIKPNELKDTLKYTAPDFTVNEDSLPELKIYPINGSPVLVYILKAYKGEQRKINLRRVIIDSSNGKLLKVSPLVIQD